MSHNAPHRRGRPGSVAGLSCSLLLCFAVFVWAETGKAYRAEQVTSDAEGKVIAKARVWAEPQMFRMEGMPFGDDFEPVVIVRKDRGLQMILNPKARLYMERPYSEDQQDVPTGLEVAIEKVSEKDLGTEEIQGFPCRKKRITTRVKVMGHAQTSTTTVWTAEGFLLPLKTLSEDGLTGELRDIRLGRQDKALFEVPPGYRRVEDILALGGLPSLPKKTADEENPELPEEILQLLKKRVR